MNSYKTRAMELVCYFPSYCIGTSSLLASSAKLYTVNLYCHEALKHKKLSKYCILSV